MNVETSPLTADLPASTERHSLGDRLFGGLTWLSAVAVLLVLGAIIVMLYLGARPAFEKFGFWHFITTAQWNR